MEAGGEVAANLRRLYEYLDRRLLESNIKKEAGGIKEVIARITVLRDAWSAMLSGSTTTLEETEHSSTSSSRRLPMTGFAELAAA